MELPITSLLAGAAAILLVLLSFPIANHRRKNQLSSGDGGDDRFNRMIRAQANFTEYMPVGLIVIGLTEMGGAAQLTVCGLAAMLAVGRLLHPFGLIANQLWARALGMVLTLLALLGAGARLLYAALV